MMYLSSDKPRNSSIDFYKESSVTDRTILIEPEQQPQPPPPPHNHHHQFQQQQQQLMIMTDNNNNNTSSGDDHELRAPKKRAETWVQEETRILIGLRREVDRFFNTSKSNKHLWEQISSKMREKGFDRSPTMCTDKWRNLLKEFKKVKHKNGKGGNTKMLYYKDLEELIRDRSKNGTCYKPAAAVGSPTSSKLDSFIQFSDKGLEDASIPFGPMEANARSTVNLERPLDDDGDPLVITTAEVVAANGVPPWNWRETPGNGVSIKICHHDESEHIGVRTEDKTFYSDEDLHEFLTQRGLSGLREINRYRSVNNVDDLRLGAVYQGVRLLGE